jgi:hypothetical protein
MHKNINEGRQHKIMVLPLPDFWLGMALVPHSQCSRRENPKFRQNFKSKYNTQNVTFDCSFYLTSVVIVIQASH